MAAEPGGNPLMDKIGPLPAVAWIGIAGVIFYVIYERNKKNGTAANSQTTVTTPATLNTTASGQIVDPVTGYLQGSAADVAALSSMYDLTTPSSNTPAGTSQQYSSNNAWGVAAIAYITSLGESPSVASQAVGQYLAGNVQASGANAIISAAIQQLGPPPVIPSAGSAQSSASATQTMQPYNPASNVGPPSRTSPPPARTPGPATSAIGAGWSNQGTAPTSGVGQPTTAPPSPSVKTQQPSRKPVAVAASQPPGPAKKKYGRKAPAQGAPVPDYGTQGGGKNYSSGIGANSGGVNTGDAASNGAW